MPLIHEKAYIDYGKFGGVPDIIWCAKLVLTLTIDYPNPRMIKKTKLNLIQDLGIDPNINNIKAIDFDDGTGVHFIHNNNINIDYDFLNNMKTSYNMTLYSDNDKIIYYPIEKNIDDFHIKTDGVKFNYNPKEKPLMKYTKRQIVANGYRIPSLVPHKAEDIFYMYVGQDLVFGSLVNVKELYYDIEITDPKAEIRLINPLSHPRFSWERLKNHVDISWGDGFITKWLDFYINSGRFNREIGYKLEHKYDNAKVGDKFTIKIKSLEPLTPIGCKVTKIYGEFPKDNYIVKDSKVSDEIVGLFGNCNHEDYPELSLLAEHRNTVKELGEHLLDNILNTNMTSFFENFIALVNIPNGFFDRILGNVRTYKKCFKGNTLLGSVPSGLIGYVNNVVIDIDEMFMNCKNIVNSLNLRKSESLVSANSVYSGCSKFSILDPYFLYECPNLRFINRICSHCTSLVDLNVNQFLLSENIEEMEFAFYNTYIKNAHTLQNKGNLWNMKCTFAFPHRHGVLTEVPENMFLNACNRTDKPLDLTMMIECQGGGKGLNLPVGLFSPLKDAKDIKSINGILSYCHFRGSDIPSDLFRDVFNKNKAKDSYSCDRIFGYPSCTNEALEIRNKQFTGDNSKLTGLIAHFASYAERHPFGYISKDYLSELPNLTNVDAFFYGSTMNLIFPEDFLKNQRKLKSARSFLRNCIYKYSHFPIDYLFHTDSDTLDISYLFKDSNIKTYRLIHWSSNKNMNITTEGIFADNTQTVPLSYILDGRNNLNTEIPYKPSTIKFITLCGVGDEITVEALGNIIEPYTIDWGDGHVVEVNTNISKHITTTAQTEITVTGRNSVKVYVVGLNLDCQEIHGEFPYNSEISEDINYRNHHYLDPIYHIAKDYGETHGSTSSYVHPHYYKHATRLKRIKNDEYTFLSGIPSKFYYNCQGLETLKNVFNYNIQMIPQNALPDTLNYSNNYTPEFFLGYLHDDHINRNKVHIFNDLIEKEYMNKDVNFPFGSSYVTIPWNSHLKPMEMINEPMYEYLGFVINKSVVGLGLERLVSGDTSSIGNIKIEIRTPDKYISKEVTINNDSELNNIIGDITLDRDKFATIKVYSSVPLWLNNHDIIDELRGVIPKCELSKPMSSLAPNLSYTSETIFMRVTNKSFRGTMANLPRLRFIHRNLFICNTDANDFESCFENDTGLYMVPDYLLSAKDFDINCKKMFRGCTNIDYIYRPICDSVRGLIEVDEMFNGCLTVNFNDAEIDPQVFNKLWYKGNSGLKLKSLSSGIPRALVDHPTTIDYTDGLNKTNLEACKACTYINGPAQTTLVNEGNEEKLKYMAYKGRTNLAYEIKVSKNNKNIEDMSKILKFLPNVSIIEFAKDELWNDGTTFDPRLFMYQERLHTITYTYSNTLVNTPIDNSFLTFNESINNIEGFLLNSGMKDINSTDRSAILGYDHLGYAFLGAEGVRIPLELGSTFFTSNMECIDNLKDSFRNLWGDFSTDTWIIGKCHPLHFDGTFAVDDNKLDIKYIGVPLTENLVKNIWNINSNPSKSELFNAYVEFIDTFKGNPNVTDGQGFIDRVLKVAAYKPNGIVRSVFENTNLSLFSINEFNDGYYPETVEFSNVYRGTNIKKLPMINNIKNSKAFNGMVSDCGLLSDNIPEDYIDSNMETCDISNMFSGSLLIKVNNKFIKDNNKTTYNISNSLTDVVSTIGSDSKIYGNVNYINESNVFIPNNMLSVNESDVFIQAIRVNDNTTVYNTSLYTFNKSVMDYVIKDKLQIDWGDGSTVTILKDQPIFEDDLTHTYKKSGIYYVRMYLDGITMFINTKDIGYIDTVGISAFSSDDCYDIYDKLFEFSLETYFGNKLTYVEDYLFRHMKNIDIIKALSLFRNQTNLRNEPKIITSDFKSLISLYEYYKGCTGLHTFDFDVIPDDIKCNIENVSGMYENTGIIDSRGILSGYDNIIVSNRFLNDCKDLRYLNTDIIRNKSKLEEVSMFISGTNIELNKSFNEFFYGCNSIKYIYQTFKDLSIKEFPDEIFYYIPNVIYIKEAFLCKIDFDKDNEFILQSNLFKYNTKLKDITNIFKNRIKLIGYEKDIFKNTNISIYDGSFKNTGITTIYEDTILNGDNPVSCISMFSNCPVNYIENNIIRKNDTRVVLVDNMLANIKGMKSTKDIFGSTKVSGVSGYTQIVEKYSLNIIDTSKGYIHLIPENRLVVFPINVEYTIFIGFERYNINRSFSSLSEFKDNMKFNLNGNSEVKVHSINSPKLSYIIDNL